MLLWQRSSNLSDFFSYERFCFCFSPCPKPLFLLGWLLNGGSALPPTTATTTAVRWQGPLPLVAGYVPHGGHLPSTCGRHCSAEHIPRHEFWSLLLVAGHAPHRGHLPSTCGRYCSSEHTPRPSYWSHQFTASWSETTPQWNCPRIPIILVCSALCQHVAQHMSATCQHKPQDRISTCTFFLRFGALRHMHDTPRTSILEATVRRTFHADFAC